MYWSQDPTSSTLFFRTLQIDGASTDLLLCVRRISCGSSSDGPETEVYKR